MILFLTVFMQKELLHEYSVPIIYNLFVDVL